MEFLWWWVRFYAGRVTLILCILIFAFFSIKGRFYRPKFSAAPQSREAGLNAVKSEIDAYEVAKDKLSEAQKETLREAGFGKGSFVVEVYSPATAINKEIEKTRDSVNTAQANASSFKDALLSKRGMAKSALVLFFQLSAALMLIFRLAKLWNQLRVFSTLLMELSKAALITISVFALIGAFGFNYNLWSAGNYTLLWVPAGLLCVGALGTTWLDKNSMIWRAIAKDMLFPLISGGVILLKNLFA